MASLLKKATRAVSRSQLFARFVSILESVDRQHANGLRVLTYHRVDEPDAKPELYPGTLSTTPDEFARQIEYVAAHCRVVQIHDVLSALLGGSALPPRSVLITFDDAYRDFSEHAWPTLRRFGLPATLFVPTAYPDQPERRFWWDRVFNAVQQMDAPEKHRRHLLRDVMSRIKLAPHEQAMQIVDEFCRPTEGVASTNEVLGWDELRHLAAEGVALAPHTRSHPLMNRISIQVARREVVSSRDDLQREIGKVPPVFAYPDGAFDDAVADMLLEEGFQLAFTTRRGTNTICRTHPMRFRRMNVGRNTTPAIVRFEMLSLAGALFNLQPARSAH
jgi:peptidoglycan/xylan/chitin deacetylase (PgdA/CDA1 family)